jgi:hypothetical protein
MKPDEVRALPAEKLRRIVVMEARAEPRLTAIQGLWGVGCKGTRGSVKKPGRMTDLIRDEHLLPAADIDRLRRRTPLELAPAPATAGEFDFAGPPPWPEFFCDLDGGEG